MFLGCHTPNTVVMAGLVPPARTEASYSVRSRPASTGEGPAIHVLKIKSWIPGTRPSMTDAM